MNTAHVRAVPCSVRPSPRLLHACAAFGLAVTRARRRTLAPEHLADARDLHAALAPGHIALVTGPSGSGKSTVLRALRRQLRRGATSPTTHIRGTIVDAFPGFTADAISALARAGLADAIVLARTPSELSEGERARFHIALALSRAPRAGTILLDEFLSTLDRATARNVAASLRRWMDREGAKRRVRLICATAHDDVLDWLLPEVLLIRDLTHPRGMLISS